MSIRIAECLVNCGHGKRVVGDNYDARSLRGLQKLVLFPEHHVQCSHVQNGGARRQSVLDSGGLAKKRRQN